MKQDETMKRVVLSHSCQVFISDVQKLFAIVLGITRRKLSAVVRQLTFAAATIGLVRPRQPDAVTQAFPSCSEAVVAGWRAAIASNLPFWQGQCQLSADSGRLMRLFVFATT